MSGPGEKPQRLDSVDNQIKKPETQADLVNLKTAVESGGPTEGLLVSFIDRVKPSLKEDLIKNGITDEARHEAIFSDYKERILKLNEGGLDTKEFEKLNAFATNADNFTELKKAIKERKVPAMIDDMINTAKGLGVDLGDFAKLTGDKVANFIAMIAKFFGRDELFGIPAQNNDAPSPTSEVATELAINFEKKHPLEVMAFAANDKNGQQAKDYLSKLFPEKFGKLESIGETELIFRDKDNNQKEKKYKVGINNMGAAQVTDGKNIETFDGSQTGLVSTMEKLAALQKNV